MKVKTADLIDLALDWAVASIEGYECQFDDEVSGPWLVPQEGFLHDEKPLSKFSPSTDWRQGGPIIEREGITVSALYAQNESPIKEFQLGEWGAYIPFGTKERGKGAAPTPLVASMRCFVASKLGDEVDIPEELLT